VHAGHGYLVSGFLSAGYNVRVDRWGGCIDNRARLTCDVISSDSQPGGTQLSDSGHGVDGEQRAAPADTVVIASGARPGTSLADRLRAAGLDARVAGDAGELGYIYGAVHSAWQVAREL
jgi:hypothetical protein